MTPSQRDSHIALINSLLTKYGATLDKWGQYHLNNYKFDTRKNNLKIFFGKIKIRSQPLTKVSLEMFENLLIFYEKEGMK